MNIVTTKKTYKEILQNNFSFGDKLFFLINCYDKPNLFIKCYGSVVSKEIHKNNIRYHIKLIKFLHTKTEILDLQDRSFRMIINRSKRSKLKKLQLLDIVNQFNFDELLTSRLDKYSFVVNNFFCVRTEEELENLFIETNLIAKKTIESLLK